VFSLEASAQLEDWRITKTSPVRFSARAQRTPLEGLKAALGFDYPVGGYLSGQVNLVGTASNLQGTGTVRVENGNISGETVDSFSTNIRVGESTWDLDSIQILKDHGIITGKAQLRPSDHWMTCQLHGGGFSLAEFKRLALAFPNSAPSLQLQGQASFDLQGGGTPDNFRFGSTLLVEGITVAGTQVGDLHVQLDGEGQNLRIQGIGSGPGGMFSLGGEAKTSGDSPLQLQGQFVSVRLDPWARLLLNNRLGGQATASGFFKANGSLHDASKFQMQGRLETLEVSFPSLNGGTKIRWSGGLPPISSPLNPSACKAPPQTLPSMARFVLPIQLLFPFHCRAWRMLRC
jgi:hypothetical protein